MISVFESITKLAALAQLALVLLFVMRIDENVSNPIHDTIYITDTLHGAWIDGVWYEGEMAY